MNPTDYQPFGYTGRVCGGPGKPGMATPDPNDHDAEEVSTVSPKREANSRIDEMAAYLSAALSSDLLFPSNRPTMR